MARPAAFAKQYSGAAFTGRALARDSAGMTTRTTACLPFRAVSRSRAWQAVALSDTASCVGATKATGSVPHNGWAGAARSGPDVYTSHRPELAPDATIRGAVTVRFPVSGCRWASWIADGPERPRQPAISATRESTATRTTARRNRYCRAETGR